MDSGSDAPVGAGYWAVRAMSHMPKRATQHGVFLSGAEAPIAALKPGQEELHRQYFYTTEAKALQETYLAQDSFKDSIYSKSLSKLTLPEDYLEKTQAVKIPLPGPGGYLGTEHWTSE